jgi:hypothetical protein
MAAFSQFVLARLGGVDRHRSRSGEPEAGVPVVAAFGRTPRLSLRWHVDGHGRLASRWQGGAETGFLVPPY